MPDLIRTNESKFSTRPDPFLRTKDRAAGPGLIPPGRTGRLKRSGGRYLMETMAYWSMKLEL